MIFTVANLKGGPGKTTTSVYLSAGLHSTGHPVNLLDSDPQGSALAWGELAGFPWLTVAMPTTKIHDQVAHMGPATLIIDTPPQGKLIISSAIRAAAKGDGLLIIPLQPTTADVNQLGETLALADESAGLDGVRTLILLTRVVPGTRSRRQVRQALADQGLHVLESEVRQSQALGLAHGRPITELRDYGPVLDELLTKVTP